MSIIRTKLNFGASSDSLPNFTVTATHSCYKGEPKSRIPIFDAVRGMRKDFINLRITPRTKNPWGKVDNETFGIKDVKKIIEGLSILVKIQQKRRDK
jgi:hypothetical protein